GLTWRIPRGWRGRTRRAARPGPLYRRRRGAFKDTGAVPRTPAPCLPGTIRARLAVPASPAVPAGGHRVRLSGGNGRMNLRGLAAALAIVAVLVAACGDNEGKKAVAAAE